VVPWDRVAVSPVVLLALVVWVVFFRIVDISLPVSTPCQNILHSPLSTGAVYVEISCMIFFQYRGDMTLKLINVFEVIVL